MSLMIIAITGILLGFLCVLIGFFMEGVDGKSIAAPVKKARAPKRRTAAHGRKAA